MKNLNHLLVLHAVATTGSVTAGAEKLLLTQPAVSKSLKHLERSLGHRLFTRTPKGIRLTPEGQITADTARRVLALTDDLTTKLADLSSLRTGQLRVGATPTLGTYLRPDLLVRFRRKFPGIRLHLEIGATALITARLTSGDLDLGLTESPPDSPTLTSTVFAKDTLLPITSPTHKFANSRNLAPKLFCAQPHILHEPAPHSLSFIQQTMANKRLSITPTLTLPTTEAIKRAVAAGLGVAFVSRLAITQELRTQQLASPSLRGLTLTRPLYQSVPKNTPETKPLIAFLCLLKHAARGTLPPHRN